MSIERTIEAYYGKTAQGVPWRYRSWEHCYRFFRSAGRDGLRSQRDPAALQLAFYLASWGMYRGSSFLLQYDYTIHVPVVDGLANAEFAPLCATDFGADEADEQLIPTILSAVGAIRKAYKPYGEATDTLVTKVLLGTLGCVPACDRFFIDGFKSAGFKYSYLNKNFLRRSMRFCRENLHAVKREQTGLRAVSGIDYPLMKIVDMHFWQIGFERSESRAK
jgi:hypothetical protein